MDEKLIDMPDLNLAAASTSAQPVPATPPKIITMADLGLPEPTPAVSELPPVKTDVAATPKLITMSDLGLPEPTSAPINPFGDPNVEVDRSFMGDVGTSLVRGGLDMVKLVPQVAKIVGSDILGPVVKGITGTDIVKEATTPFIKDIEALQASPLLKESKQAGGAPIDLERIISNPGEVLGQIGSQISNPRFWASQLPEGAMSMIPAILGGWAPRAMQAGKTITASMTAIKASTVLTEAEKIAQLAPLAAKLSRMSTIGTYGMSMAMEAGQGEEKVRAYDEAHPDKPVSWGSRVVSILGTGVVAGSLEAFSLGKVLGGGMLGRVPIRSAEAVTIENILNGKGGREIVKKVLEGVATEGLTEGAQSIVENAFPRGFFDKNQKLLEGVVESMLIGAALGGLGGGASGITQHLDVVKTEAARIQDLKAKAQEEAAPTEAPTVEAPATPVPAPEPPVGGTFSRTGLDALMGIRPTLEPGAEAAPTAAVEPGPVTPPPAPPVADVPAEVAAATSSPVVTTPVPEVTGFEVTKTRKGWSVAGMDFTDQAAAEAFAAKAMAADAAGAPLPDTKPVVRPDAPMGATQDNVAPVETKATAVQTLTGRRTGPTETSLRKPVVQNQPLDNSGSAKQTAAVKKPVVEETTPSPEAPKVFQDGAWWKVEGTDRTFSTQDQAQKAADVIGKYATTPAQTPTTPENVPPPGLEEAGLESQAGRGLYDLVGEKLGLSPEEVAAQMPADLSELSKPENQNLPIAKAVSEVLAERPDLTPERTPPASQPTRTPESTPVVTPSEAAAKEPWEMGVKEYKDFRSEATGKAPKGWRDDYQRVIERAILAGKVVPEAIVKESGAGNVTPLPHEMTSDEHLAAAMGSTEGGPKFTRLESPSGEVYAIITYPQSKDIAKRFANFDIEAMPDVKNPDSIRKQQELTAIHEKYKDPDNPRRVELYNSEEVRGILGLKYFDHKRAVDEALASGKITPERARELGHFDKYKGYPDLAPAPPQAVAEPALPAGALAGEVQEAPVTDMDAVRAFQDRYGTSRGVGPPDVGITPEAVPVTEPTATIPPIPKVRRGKGANFQRAIERNDLAALLHNLGGIEPRSYADYISTGEERSKLGRLIGKNGGIPIDVMFDEAKAHFPEQFAHFEDAGDIVHYFLDGRHERALNQGNLEKQIEEHDAQIEDEAYRRGSHSTEDVAAAEEALKREIAAERATAREDFINFKPDTAAKPTALTARLDAIQAEFPDLDAKSIELVLKTFPDGSTEQIVNMAKDPKVFDQLRRQRLQKMSDSGGDSDQMQSLPGTGGLFGEEPTKLNEKRLAAGITGKPLSFLDNPDIKGEIDVAHSSREEANNVVQEMVKDIRDSQVENADSHQKNGVPGTKPILLARSGSPIARELLRTGQVELTQLRLRHPHAAQDLAELFQVFRNPRVEILHTVFTDANDNILAANAITSGAINHITPKSVTRLLTKIKSQLDRLGAKQVHFIHNHPSGNAVFSEGDKNLWRALKDGNRDFRQAPNQQVVEGLGDRLGENVVIDHGKHSYMDKDGIPQSGTYNVLPDMPDWVSGKVEAKNPQQLAEAVSGFKYDQKKTMAVIYLSTDSKVMGWEPLRAEILNKPLTDVRDTLQQRMKANDGAKVALIVNDSTAIDNFIAEQVKAMDQGGLTPEQHFNSWLVDVLFEGRDSVRKVNGPLWKSPEYGTPSDAKKAYGLFEPSEDKYKVKEDERQPLPAGIGGRGPRPAPIERSFWEKYMPSFGTATSMAEGPKTLIFPGTKSPAHATAAQEFRPKLGEMWRSGGIVEKTLKPFRDMFAKLGVYNEDAPVPERIGTKFGSAIMRDDLASLPADQRKAAETLSDINQDRANRLDELGKGVETIEHYYGLAYENDSIRAFNRAFREAIAEGRGLAAGEGGLGEVVNPNDWSAPDKKWVFNRVGELLAEKQGSDESALEFLSRRPLKGSEGFRKPKVFDDMLTATEFGLVPISPNPIDMALLKIAAMDRSIMANSAINEWKDQGDIKFNPANHSVPAGFVKINDTFGTVYGPNDPKTGAKTILGYQVATKPVAEILNNYLSSTLYNSPYFGEAFKAYMAAGNTLNQVQLGVFSMFHGGFITIETQVNAGATIFQDLYGLLKGNRTPGQLGKSIKDFPGATVSGAIAGGKVLAEEFTPTMKISTDVPVSQLRRDGAHGVAIVAEATTQAGGRYNLEYGLRTNQIAAMQKDWQSDNKVMAALRAPLAFVEWSAKPIQDWFVPRMKAAVFGVKVGRIIDMNPTKTMKELAPQFSEAWNSTDATMGQVVWDRYFLNNIAKNIIQAVIRAPGWTGGTIAQVGGAPLDAARFVKEWIKTGKAPENLPPRVAYTMSLLTMVAVANGIMTYALTGEPPEGVDYWAFRDGGKDAQGNPTRWLFPSYVKDLFAWGRAPGHTAWAKTHPLISLISDVVKNKNYYGEEIANKDDTFIQQQIDRGKFVLETFTPFWMAGAGKAAERDGGLTKTIREAPEKLVAPLVGVMPAARAYTVTEAQKVMDSYNQLMRPAMTTKQVQEEKRLKKDLRTYAANEDEEGFKDTAKVAIEKGILTRKQVEAVAESSKEPIGSGRFKAVPLSWQVKAMKVATDKEKAVLEPLFLKKIMAAAKSQPEMLIRERGQLVPLLRDLGYDDPADAIENLAITERGSTIHLAGLGIRRPTPEMGDVEAVNQTLTQAINKGNEELGAPKKERKSTKPSRFSVLGF